MAGLGHGSVTGLDERTLGRIDLLLYDADYRSPAAAVEDSWRIAVLAADPRLRDERERVRAAAVDAANLRRDPDAHRIATAGFAHRLALAAAILLAGGAAGLILTTGSRIGTLHASLLPAGMCAALATGMLWWLEPRRANGSLWGSRIPAALHMFCAGLWLFAAAVAFVLRWDEIDGYRALPATTGLTLLVASAGAMVWLWARAVRADRAGHRSGVERVTGDLLDRRDAEDVFAALDGWWEDAGPQAMRRSGERVRRVRVEVLARLEASGLVTSHHVRFALGAADPVRWSERRA